MDLSSNETIGHGSAADIELTITEAFQTKIDDLTSHTDIASHSALSTQSVDEDEQNIRTKL
jgi:hypothetical protein